MVHKEDHHSVMQSFGQSIEHLGQSIRGLFVRSPEPTDTVVTRKKEGVFASLRSKKGVKRERQGHLPRTSALVESQTSIVPGLTSKNQSAAVKPRPITPIAAPEALQKSMKDERYEKTSKTVMRRSKPTPSMGYIAVQASRASSSSIAAGCSSSSSESVTPNGPLARHGSYNPLAQHNSMISQHTTPGCRFSSMNESVVSLNGSTRQLFKGEEDEDYNDTDISRASSVMSLTAPDPENNATFLDLIKNYPSRDIRCGAVVIENLLKKFQKNKSLRAITPIISNGDLKTVMEKFWESSNANRPVTRSQNSKLLHSSGISHHGRESNEYRKLGEIDDERVAEIVRDFQFKLTDDYKVYTMNDSRAPSPDVNVDKGILPKKLRRPSRNSFVSPEANAEYTMKDLQNYEDANYFPYRSTQPKVSRLRESSKSACNVSSLSQF